MLELWAMFALVAMLANVVKVVLVKTQCHGVDNWQLLFAARLLPAVLLLALLPWVDYHIHDGWAFWGATLAASVITLGASLLYMQAVKHGALSLVTPIQATIPMFMIGCTALWYGEVPGIAALGFILLIVISVSLVLYQGGRFGGGLLMQGQGGALLMSLAAAALFGVSTVLDRVAIAATSQGALVFTAYWHVITLCLLMLLMAWRRQAPVPGLWRQRGVVMYVLAVLVAFLAQQYAVQDSLDLDNGVTYVKTIVMAHIVLASLIGVGALGERAPPGIGLASVLTLVGGIGLLWVQ